MSKATTHTQRTYICKSTRSHPLRTFKSLTDITPALMKGRSSPTFAASYSSTRDQSIPRNRPSTPRFRCAVTRRATSTSWRISFLQGYRTSSHLKDTNKLNTWPFSSLVQHKRLCTSSVHLHTSTELDLIHHKRPCTNGIHHITSARHYIIKLFKLHTIIMTPF